MNPIKKVTAWLTAACYALLLKMTTSRAAILAKDRRGMVDIVDLILLGIGVFIIGYLIPLGITAAVNANTTGWDPTVKTIWTVFWPLMAVLFVVIFMVYSIKGHGAT